jgi:hypothetical protein
MRLRLCRACQRVVIATTEKLLRTKLKGASAEVPLGRPINGFDRVPVTAA